MFHFYLIMQGIFLYMHNRHTIIKMINEIDNKHSTCQLISKSVSSN